jgi:hypothetical protein
MTLKEAQSKREMADELRRTASEMHASVMRRSVPIATKIELGDIGILEYQADRLCEQALEIERNIARRPWWARLVGSIGGRNEV